MIGLYVLEEAGRCVTLVVVNGLLRRISCRDRVPSLGATCESLLPLDRVIWFRVARF